MAQQEVSKLIELTQFAQWSIFIPRAVSQTVEKNAVYVRSRARGNPKFFEQTREKLKGILNDCDFLVCTDSSDTISAGEALEKVLAAQWIAHGFLHNRQPHKSLVLGELCVGIADNIYNVFKGSVTGLLFWRLLCRANLGQAYTAFGKRTEAQQLLKEGLSLAEEAMAGQRELGLRVNAQVAVLTGVCHAHLGRIDRDEGRLDESLRNVDVEIERFESHLFDLSDSKEDREVQALVLAAAYSVRGGCDVQLRRYDSALSWLTRSLECVEKHQDLSDLSNDAHEMLSLIRADIESTRHMQS